MFLELTLAFLLSLAISLGLNRLMLGLAPKLGLMDEPGERRIHSTAIPRAGGIAIWLAFLLVTGGILSTGWLDVGGHLSWRWFGAFAAGSTVLMAAGFKDDRTGLSPWVKLVAHVLAPTVFFLLHPLRTGVLPESWPMICEYVLFVGWVVVLINAFNLIDGLDGLCGGLAAVSAAAMAALALFNGRPDSAMLLLVMCGAVLGFLRYNISPARIFLGDAGSMLMGFFLATAATDAVGRKAVVGVIMLPIAVAGVPLLDVLLAVWRRGARRFIGELRGDKAQGGIFEADSDHLHHRLLRERGRSQRKVAGILQGVAIILAVLGFLPMLFGDRAFRVSLVGFLIVGLLGLRNLARVEIEHTGSVIHMAIKLPGHRRRVAAVLFLYDLLVLAGAAASAVVMETNLLTRGDTWQNLGQFVVMFVITGSIALLAVKVHQRLWVRATMRDIIALQFCLLVAAAATFALYSLIHMHTGWSCMRLTVISYVLACAGVCLPRVVLDLMRELGLEAFHHNPKRAAHGSYGPVVVLGAGDLGTLLLDHLKASDREAYPGMRILGFIDDMQVLHGRWLRSFQILGGLSAVSKLVKEEGLKGIILAINSPGKELLDQLEELADRYDLTIYRWKAVLEEEL